MITNTIAPQTPARQKCEKPCNIERVLFAHIRVFRKLVVVVVDFIFFVVDVVHLCGRDDDSKRI